MFFDVFQVFNQALDIIKDITLLFNFQVNGMICLERLITIQKYFNVFNFSDETGKTI